MHGHTQKLGDLLVEIDRGIAALEKHVQVHPLVPFFAFEAERDTKTVGRRGVLWIYHVQVRDTPTGDHNVVRLGGQRLAQQPDRVRGLGCIGGWRRYSRRFTLCLFLLPHPLCISLECVHFDIRQELRSELLEPREAGAWCCLGQSNLEYPLPRIVGIILSAARCVERYDRLQGAYGLWKFQAVLVFSTYGR